MYQKYLLTLNCPKCQQFKFQQHLLIQEEPDVPVVPLIPLVPEVPTTPFTPFVPLVPLYLPCLHLNQKFQMFQWYLMCHLHLLNH
jgi:hypothetical protein